MARPPHRQVDASDSDNDSSTSNHVVETPVDAEKTLQHLFLQAFVSRRVVETKLAQRIYAECAKICGVNGGEFAGFLSDLEEKLQVLGLDIKRLRDQETGENYIILINTVSDAAAKLATDFKPEEIVFFRAIVGEIMSTDDLSYSVTMKEALRCMKGSRTVGQELVKSFIAKGWLRLHLSQRLTLSVRALAELGGWLRDIFDEDEEALIDCSYCNAIVTSGFACPNSDCRIRLHSFCVDGRLHNGRCPDSISGRPGACDQEWIRTANGKYKGTPIGLLAVEAIESLDDESAVGSTPATERRTSSSAPAARKRRRPPMPTSDAASDAASDEEVQLMEE